MGISRDVKAELARRVAVASEPAFLDAHLRAYMDGGGANGATDAGWQVRVIQLDSTGAATVEVRHGAGPAVFAKFFPHGEGLAVHDKLADLRRAGFGPESAHQVVEPLAYLPALDLVLTREAPGPAASVVIGEGGPEATLTAARRAGTWLGSLHSAPVRIGVPHSLIVSTEVLSVARRLAKVSAEHPDTVPAAVARIEQLERLAEDTVDGVAVQSHGQYRPIHVFLGEEATTVIDLDRSRPADPSRDVAEFCHRLRRQLFGAGRDAEAEPATTAFLDAYRATVPDPDALLVNLRFQWARYVFHSMTRKRKHGGDRDTEDAGAVARYELDFDALVDGRLGA